MKAFIPVSAGLAVLCLSAVPVHAANWADSPSMKQHQAALRAQWDAHPHPGKNTEPFLIAGKVLTPAVNVQVAPGQVEVSLTIAAGTVGYSDIAVELTSPDGLHFVQSSAYVPAYPPQKGRQNLTIQVQPPFAGDGLTLYSEPGNWTVSSVDIFANDGSRIPYTGSQLAALFPSVTVAVTNDGTPDTTPPTVSHGRILTPTVSLSSPSPFFAASLTVADDLSGVASASVELSSDSGGFGAGTQLLAPVVMGKVTAFAQLQPGFAMPGTYTITGLYVCDVAQNCFSTFGAAGVQKVFGANVTVQVTN